MFKWKAPSTLQSLLSWAAVFCVATMVTPQAHAAQHLWNLQELYTNNSGTLQFIELKTTFGSQQFVGGFTISSTNLAMNQTNMFTIPTNLPSDSTNHTFLLGTTGIQAAGGPAPDYIIPNNFLFAAGGSISFFGQGSGPYSALPTDGLMSRIWGGGNNLTNSPTNFAFQTGTVIGVPEPTTMILSPFAMGGMYWMRRRAAKARGVAT
jgi:hypothetical protein